MLAYLKMFLLFLSTAFVKSHVWRVGGGLTLEKKKWETLVSQLSSRTSDYIRTLTLSHLAAPTPPGFSRFLYCVFCVSHVLMCCWPQFEEN